MLPEVLENVTAPPLFGPSTFASLMRCPLKEIHGLPEEDMLAPSPLAILGNVIHEVMKRSPSPAGGSSGERMTEYVDELFEEEIRREGEVSFGGPTHEPPGSAPQSGGENRISNPQGTPANLGEDATPQRWRSDPDSATGLRKVGCSTRPRGRACGHHSHPHGAEQPLRVSSLRLSGRPDLIEIDGEGTYHVTDFKTGDVLDRAGEPRRITRCR